MKYIKYFKILILILVICVIFTGCHFTLETSIDDLISPVSPFGENAKIQSALDVQLKTDYSLLTPSSGKNLNSFNFVDLNGDGVEEAVTFYEMDDQQGTSYIAILGKDSEWKVLSIEKGSGSDVFSLEFADLDDDKVSEIIVCWNLINDSANHTLCVYDYNDDKNELKLIPDPISVNNYVCTDFNDHKGKELIVLQTSEINKFSRSKAILYYWTKSKLKQISETSLDSNVSQYSNIEVDYDEGRTRVFVDAIKSNGSSMLTEVLLWNNNYGEIISPYYSYSTGRTSGTTRKSLIPSLDVDKDKVVEMPINTNKIKISDKNLIPINWVKYRNTTSIHSAYSVDVTKDRYTVVISDSNFDDLSYSYNKDKNELVVSNKSTKKTVFKTRKIYKSQYNNDEYSDYSILLDSDGYYYLYQSGNDKEIKYNEKQIKNNFIVYN